jgi:sodium pump decarboxylase gamma subunit
MEAQIEKLISAFWIMLFGMVIVFVFLGTMIIILELTHQILKITRPKDFIVQNDDGQLIEQAEPNDKNIMAVIAAAIARYTSKK